MDFITPKYSATDICAVARIEQGTLQNWLAHGLLDRLGTTRPEGSWRKYSLLDVLTVAAEAQLAFLGVAPKVRNVTRFSERIAATCMTIINKFPINPVLTFTSDYCLGAVITFDCRTLADEVLSALHMRT